MVSGGWILQQCIAADAAGRRAPDGGIVERLRAGGAVSAKPRLYSQLRGAAAVH